MASEVSGQRFNCALSFIKYDLVASPLWVKSGHSGKTKEKEAGLPKASPWLPTKIKSKMKKAEQVLP
jgi:hypothetical protein